MVWGEAPHLLDEDMGGSAYLDLNIEDVLEKARAALAQPEPARQPTFAELLMPPPSAALAQPEPARQPTFAELLMPPPSAALAQPAPVAPTDEEIYKLALDGDFLVDVGDGVSCMVQDEVDFARAVLARWGTPTAQPVPVSERLPGPENCDAEGRCWWWHEETGDVLPHWVFAPAEVVENQYLAWLPHWTLPVPGVEGEP
jgi:hypothetical protein